VAISYKKITPFDTSFGLVRTNPKLTGNVKLVVDSSQNLYFESIEANAELAKDKYKAYPIDPTSQHDSNLYRFFSNGNTPESIVFSVKTNVALDSTSSNFADQYDFSEYFSGARYCISKNYSEKFKYFAPIYLNKELPEKFVIFKIPGASHKAISETRADYPYNKPEHLKSILENAQVVKTFDLGVDSHIGKYIKKMQSNPLFPSNTLNFPFNRGLLSSYSGIAYKAGCYTEKFENLQDIIIGGKTITDFEEYVTLGYERNAVIYPYILNLEFLFDDSSDDFEFNRYFGIYCNTVDIANLDFDLSDHAALKLNTPIITDPNAYEYAQLSFTQTNSTGLDLKFHTIPSSVSAALTELDGAGILTLEDKNGDLHKINSVDTNSSKLNVSTKSLDLSLLHGPTEIFLEDSADYTKGGIQSFIEIKLDAIPNHLDQIRIYYPNGKATNQNSKRYETVTAVSNFSYDGSPVLGALALYNEYGPDQFFYSVDYVQQESLSTNLEKMAESLTEAINAIQNSGFKAYSYQNRIFIVVNTPGNVSLEYAVQYIPAIDEVKITISDEPVFRKTAAQLLGTGTSTQIDLTYRDYIVYGEATPIINQTNYSFGALIADAGTKTLTFGSGNLDQTIVIGCHVVNFEPGSALASHISVDSQYFDKLHPNKEDLLIQATSGWVEIENIVSSIDYINAGSFETESEKIFAINYYDNNINILTEQGTEALLKFGLVQFKKKFKPAVSALSIIPIKDFDFDHADSQYSSVQLSDVWKSAFIPEGINMINLEKSAYRVLNGSIKIGSTIYNDGDLIEKTLTPTVVSFSTLTGDPFVIPAISVNSPTYDVELSETNPDILDFKGFFTITSDYAEISPSKTNSYIYRDRFTSGKVSSEYDSNYERYLIENAGKNRLVKYICKWGADGSLDARSNPYRLNSDTVFGVNNFSPEPNKVEPDSSSMTHEWFYIESLYDYIYDPTAAAQNKLYFDTPFDPQLAVTQEGYFEDYFIFTPSYIKNGVLTPCARTQYRFSQIKKDNLTGLAKTIFKGIKFVFKEVVPDTTETELSGALKYVRESNRFNNYRFTSILKVIEETPYSGQNPIQFKFIESKDFKFITLVIELRVGHKSTLLTSSAKKLLVTKTGDLAADEQHVFNSLSTSFSDYKLNINQVTTQSGLKPISDITLAFMYYAKNKKYNTLDNSYSSINLVNSLDLSVQAGYSENGLPFLISLDKGTDIQITDEINRVSSNSMLSFKDSNSIKVVSKAYSEKFTIEFPISATGLTPSGYGQSLTTVTLPGGTSQGITSTELNSYESSGLSLYSFVKNRIVTSNSIKESLVNQTLIIGSTITPTPLTASVEGGSSTIVLSAVPATPLLIGAEVDITGWSQFATKLVGINGTTLTLSKPIKSNINVQEQGADITSGSPNIYLAGGTNYDVENFGNEPINQTSIAVDSFASGVSEISLSSANDNVIVGCTVSGIGIAAGTTITSKVGNVLYLSANTTAASSGTYSFTRTWPNYSSTNKVYVTGTGIPANTYVIRIDNTTLDANSQVKPKVILSANATATGTGVTVKFFQKNAAADISFYQSDISHAIATQNRVSAVGSSLINVIDVLELKNTSTGSTGYTYPNAQLLSSETNSTFGILSYPGDTNLRILRLINQSIYRLENESGISEVVPTGVVLAGDVGIGEISFANLPSSNSTANSTTFNFNKIIKRELTVPSLDKSHWEAANFALLLGGESYYKGLFKRLSFTEFKRSIERGRSNVTYTTYENGVESTGNFYIEIEDATIVEKLKIPTISPVNIQLTQADTTSKRQSSNLVGYTAAESYLQNPLFLRRHGSTYSPIFREITAFMPDTTLNSEIVKDANCKFNPNANRFFEVKGFEHIKISEKKILELEGNDKYKPIFELIGETPISSGDLYLLASNWDYGFHLEYINKTDSIPAYGTRRIAEDSYFMAKLASLPTLIEIDSISSKEVTEFPSISADYINREADILYKVNTTDAQLDINLTNVFSTKVLELGLESQITASFNIDTTARNPEILGSYDFASYVKQYAIENILPNYAIDQLVFWYLEDKSKASGLEIVSKTAAERYALGYKKLEGAQINIKNGLAVQLRVPLKTTGKLSLIIEPKMKFI
jgi:hypothetical protein